MVGLDSSCIAKRVEEQSPFEGVICWNVSNSFDVEEKVDTFQVSSPSCGVYRIQDGRKIFEQCGGDGGIHPLGLLAVDQSELQILLHFLDVADVRRGFSESEVESLSVCLGAGGDSMFGRTVPMPSYVELATGEPNEAAAEQKLTSQPHRPTNQSRSHTDTLISNPTFLHHVADDFIVSNSETDWVPPRCNAAGGRLQCSP